MSFGGNYGGTRRSPSGRIVSLDDYRRDSDGVSVKHLLDLIGTINDKQQDMQSEIDFLKEEHNTFVEEVEQKFDNYKSTITRLHGDVRVLESGIGNYLPAVISIMARRTLDDGRYNVAAAFMLIFQSFFIPEQILNEFDESKSALKWDTFLNRLESFFQFHFDERDETMQSRSVFTYCRGDELTYKRSLPLPHPDHEDHPSLPTHRFSSSTIAHRECAPTLQVPTNLAADHLKLPYFSDRKLQTALKFFTPAIMWAYCELKDALIVDEAVIKQIKMVVSASEEALVTKVAEVLLDLDAELPTKDRLMVGTGTEIRSSRRWRNKFTQLNEAEERARASQAEAAQTDASSRSRRGAHHAYRGHHTPSPVPPTAPAAMRLSRQPIKRMEDDAEEPTTGSTSRGTKRKDPPKKPWGFPKGFEEPVTGINIPHDIKKHKVDGKYPLAAWMATPSLAISERDLDEVLANRAVHLWRFNIVRKALFILLDDNQIQLALFKTSKVRRLNNEFIHIPNKADEAFAVSLQQLPEVAKDIEDPLTEEEASRYQQDIASLSDMMYKHDNYFQESRDDIEKEMDEHMKIWVKHGGQVSAQNRINADALVLLSWLNEMNPLE
ncbi:hypothetical protein SCHPADRAFT_946194 [Schizopora paradoxa]|uniref:Uncharacterized protein n=1 Tax=Schizopora paradoxa TaxID=27342 RepID=A0A0H2RN73_9AGAM|nr:hypothetical protein SCHPADRAFT_946194 [Schizopora paradoxa]